MSRCPREDVISGVVKLSSFFLPTSFAVSLFRSPQPIREKTAWFSLLASVVVIAGISAAADGVIYKVHLANGVDQYLRLEVPSGITPVKVNPNEWNQPQYATAKISPNAAVLAAVAWAGGLEDHDPGYSNSLTNVGGKIPGGFYQASYIKVGDVRYQTEPFPNYLVHLNGQIGQTRQSFYADVLEDGRIVRPVPSPAPVALHSRALERANPSEKWGGAEEKMKWGGAGEKP